VGPSHWVQPFRNCSSVGSPVLPATLLQRGLSTACLTTVCSAGCRGTSDLAPGAPPAPPSALALLSAEFSLLSLAAKCHYPGWFFIPEALPPSLMGSALASGGSILEPAGVGSTGHRGSFWQLLTEATPVAPLLPKPGHANPVHPETKQNQTPQNQRQNQPCQKSRMGFNSPYILKMVQILL